MLVAEALAARFHAQALLDALPVIYLVVALDTFDYAVIVPLRRLNYLSSKAPQMLWAYVLLTVIISSICRTRTRSHAHVCAPLLRRGQPTRAQWLRRGHQCTARQCMVHTA